MSDRAPLPLARLTYDTAEVDAVVSELRARLEAAEAALEAAVARAERAERGWSARDGDEAVALGRAMLLIQRISEQMLAQARLEAGVGEGPPATAPASEPSPAVDRLRAAVEVRLQAFDEDEPSVMAEHEPLVAAATEMPAPVASWPTADPADYFSDLRAALEDDRPLSALAGSASPPTPIMLGEPTGERRRRATTSRFSPLVLAIGVAIGITASLPAIQAFI